MKRAFLAVLCFAAACLHAADLNLAALNGTWKMTAGESDQGEMPSDQREALTLILKDGTYDLQASESIARGKFTLDVGKKPAAMDFLEDFGPNAGKTLFGIVELTSDGWRAAYALDGGDRPKEFKPTAAGQFLATYQRAPGTASKPLKALLITGGCCHEYDKQAVTLMEGLSRRANVEFTLVRDAGADGTQHKVSAYQKEDWASGYDLVVHNECYADEKEPAWVERIVKPHRGGVPAVVIHCAMHCYRAPTNEWFKFVGVTSRYHGSHFAYPMTNVKPEHPVMKGFPAVWQTPKEELYVVERFEKEATPLAVGYSPETKKGEANVWVHQYGAARVFGTTVGHYNATMADPVYLDLVARGLLWACGKLDDEGKPAAGFGPR
jgi:uncharacterized protein